LLLAELSKHFPDQFEVLGHATGLHLVVQFHNKMFTDKMIHAIADNGVRIYRAGSFYQKENQERNNEIILGYSHLSSEKIAEGVKIISDIIS